MPSLIDFRRRIRSVKNTQQITKAMKLVSASKLRRTQDRVIASRPYAASLAKLLTNLAAAAKRDTVEVDPLLEVREEKRVALIVITADRGLAGAYNANINKFAARLMADRKDIQFDIEAFGRRGRDFLKKRNYHLTGEYVGILEKATFAQTAELAQKLIQRYRDGEIDAVYMVYSEFRGILSQVPTAMKILPVAAPEEGGEMVDYVYEQPPEQLLAAMLPQYVEMLVYRGVLEAVAGQHAARMAAMDAASRNCSEVIDTLTLQMNRIRQAAITKEIIEVVSGASAQ